MLLLLFFFEFLMGRTHHLGTSAKDSKATANHCIKNASSFLLFFFLSMMTSLLKKKKKQLFCCKLGVGPS